MHRLIWRLLSVTFLLAACAYNERKEKDDSWTRLHRHRDLVFTNAVVNNQSTEVLIDTASNFTVVSVDLAKKLGLAQKQAEAMVHGVSGSIPAGHFATVHIDIAECSLGEVEALILDLSEIARTLKKEVPAIIGRELFERYVVEFDFSNERMAIQDADAFLYTGDDAGLDMTRVGLDWLVDVQIEDLPPAAFRIDTADDSSVTLSHSFHSSAALLDRKKLKSSFEVTGVAGKCAIDVSTLRSIRIGSHELANVPATFLRQDSQAFGSIAGSIGIDILEKFCVTFDGVHCRLYMEPTQRIREGFKRNRAGLVLQSTEAGLQVMHVAPGSPAWRGGWMVDEIITTIDGRHVSAYEDNEWLLQEAGKEVFLTVNDELRRLVLEDYY
jgi:predicted aspartyl protease